MEIIAREGKGLFFIFSRNERDHIHRWWLIPESRETTKRYEPFLRLSGRFQRVRIGAQILRDLGAQDAAADQQRKHLVGLRGYGLEVTSLEAIHEILRFVKSRNQKRPKPEVLSMRRCNGVRTYADF